MKNLRTRDILTKMSRVIEFIYEIGYESDQSCFPVYAFLDVIKLI